jgi:hypothetical protein
VLADMKPTSILSFWFIVLGWCSVTVSPGTGGTHTASSTVSSGRAGSPSSSDEPTSISRASLVLPGISPTSVGGDMSLELELAEDPHDIRSTGSVGSIVGGPVSLTTDPVIIGTSNALSVTAPGICTVGRGIERAFALQRVVRCWFVLVLGLNGMRCRTRRVEREPTRVSAACYPKLPPTCLHR